jgi:hypothetical protein
MNDETKKVAAGLGAAWLLTLVLGGGALWAQESRIAQLDERVDALALDTPAGEAFEASDGSNDDLVSMRRRLRKLEGDLGRLRAGGGGGDALEGASPRPIALGTPAPLDTPPPRAGTPAAALVAALESEDPAVQERVRAALRREVEAIREERRDERRERRDERANEDLEAFAQKAGLSSTQTEDLKILMESEREQVREALQAARREGDFANIRARIESIREETDAEAIPNLDASQALEYEKMREEEVARFTRGFGGGRGGRGGGGRGGQRGGDR